MADNRDSRLSDRPATTIAYNQWLAYKRDFLDPSGAVGVLEQARKFYKGDQYEESSYQDLPKPCLNLCKESIDRITAKVTGTKRHVSFYADTDDKNLNKLDSFYEFQLNQMDDETKIDSMARTAFTDGTAVVFTAYDADTIGIDGLYKGFLSRKLIPFERTFWSDPFEPDPQKQRYLGYYMDMDVSAVKELIEGDEKLKAEKEKLIVDEGYFTSHSLSDDLPDVKRVRVYVRFFRIKNEVYFELATMYCNIYENPHALNPRLNERAIKEKVKEYEKKNSDRLGGLKDPTPTRILDFEVDPSRYTIFSKVIEAAAGDYEKEKSKFSRYPVTVYSPISLEDCILGLSFCSMLINNQKIVNYVYLLCILIMQNHAMPKILAKPDAMAGQTYDTTPNQIIVDYSSPQSRGGTPWGITRLSSGDAVNSNLIDFVERFIAMVRKIFGFENLDATNYSSDISGYAYSQMQQQMNLVLEIPQKLLWLAVKENARTDLMYFKHYVDSATFFERVSDAEYDLNDEYRELSQKMVMEGKTNKPKDTVLEKSKKVNAVKIDKSLFDSAFTVNIDVEQGIAGSELTESQHFNQLIGYIAQGNISADILKIIVENDPSLTAKTRASIKASIESLSVSQLAIKDQQIQALMTQLKEQGTYSEYLLKVIDMQKRKQQATEQAASDQSKVAAQLIKGAQQNTMTESEVKSNNAKGISGGSFSGGQQASQTIYNS